MSSPSEVRGGVPAESGLTSADRLCSQQVTANSPFRAEKWGTRAAQPRDVGDNVPHFWDQRGTGGGSTGSGPMKMIFASTADSLYSVKYN